MPTQVISVDSSDPNAIPQLLEAFPLCNPVLVCHPGITAYARYEIHFADAEEEQAFNDWSVRLMEEYLNRGRKYR